MSCLETYNEKEEGIDSECVGEGGAYNYTWRSKTEERSLKLVYMSRKLKMFDNLCGIWSFYVFSQDGASVSTRGIYKRETT